MRAAAVRGASPTWALLAVIVFAIVQYAALQAAASPATTSGDSTSTFTTIDDWMANVLSADPTVSASARPAAAYYKQLDKDRACFKAVNYCGSLPVSIKSALTCCEERTNHKRQDIIPQSRPIVGRLSLAAPNLGTAVTITPNLYEVGLFDLQTTLSSAAGACGVSGCEDLVLQSSGFAYKIPQVVTSRQPVLVPFECQAGYGRAPNSLQGAFTDTQMENFLNVSRVQPAPDSRAAAPTEEVVWIGTAYVYSGPVTVRSRLHEPKWQQGWADFIVPEGTYGRFQISYLSSQPFNIPFVDPEDFWAYKLELNRPEEGRRGYDRDRE